jgi:DNA-binding GntR family transcriptional regulator
MTALLSKLIIYGKAYGLIADTQFMRDVGWRGGVCPAIAMPESGGMAENVTISETASGHDGSNKPAEETRAHSGLNLSSLAYRAISEMIRDRRLKGGEQIVEARLADALGISRTPLREALQRLEGEGLVRKLANRSYLVRSVDLAEYLHSLKVREILEGEAAVLAIGRIPAEDLAKVRHEIEQLRASTSYHTASHWQSDDNLHGLYIN